MNSRADKYKQTEVGVIPDDWEVKLISEAFEIHNNLRLPISEVIRKKMQGEFPYYGPTKIQDYINEYRVEGEYALIGEDGDHFLKWNEFPMTQIASGKFNVNNHAHLIKGKSKITLTEWFYWFFKHRNITQHLTRQGAGRYKLSKATLLKIPCAIPTTKEQSAIAQVLTETDSLIASLEKLIAKKEAVKSAVMNVLLNPKSNFQLITLGEIALLQKGSQVNRSELSEEGIYAAINGGIEPSGYTDNWNTNENTITISEGGNSCGYVNFITKKFWCGGHCYTVQIKDLSVDKKYLYHLLKKNQKAIMELRVGSGLPNIQKGRLESFKLKILDSLDEQIAISQILNDIDKEMQQLEMKHQKYLQIKNGLMQNLLTGKIRLV